MRQFVRALGLSTALSCLSLPGIAAADIFGAAAGTGPMPAVAEQLASLPRHTLYRPQQLPKSPLPIFLWGNGACRDNGLSHGAFLRQIASQGYVVIALGVPREERPFDPNPAPPTPAVAPGQPEPRNVPDETQAAQLLEALDWATRENSRAGSPLQGHLDVSKVAVGGHSCGGLQAISVSDDPRIRTTLVLNSGVYVRASGGRSGVQVGKEKLATLHGPMLYLTGGPEDIAHVNASDDVARIDHLPVFMGSIPVGHGGTFWTQRDGGDWARVAARWLDWQLKQDADASWDFAGPECRLCRNPRWTVVQKKLGLPKGPFRESRYVPVRDGTKLAVNVYHPAVEGRVSAARLPVVFSYTPYRARFRGPDGVTAEMGQFKNFGLGDLTSNGYVLAVADIRGKGASFGARRGFQDRTEAMDGHDLVQWLAAQPWADGKVGMLGCSYLGGTTTHVASTAPPALKAIFTGATDIDKFAFVRRGGITAQFNTRPDEPLTDDLMSLPVDEDVEGNQMRAAVAEHARNTPMAALWYGMPYRDSVSSLTGNRFWQEAGPYPYLDTIRKAGIATYFWGNWQDEPTEQVIQWAATMKSKLLVGPGTHCVPPPGFDFAGEVRRYFDHHLKGRDTGLYREPRVTYHLDGAPAGKDWVRSAREPGAGIARQRLFLAPGANLAAQAPKADAAEPFRVDYAVGSPEYFAFWITSQREHGLSWTGAPLAADGDLVGAAVVDLGFAVDRQDADVFAYLEDVAPDGKSDVISFGRLKASQRKLVKAPYDTLGLPWTSGLSTDARPLAPGQSVRLRFALTPTAHRVPAGHRLRVVVTGADPRQRNLADLRQDPAPVYTVSQGGRGASFVELPWQH